MLQSLHIRNYVLINSLEIDFPEGLVIISGPTGAGKSIIIGALGLLLGRKADASVIAADAENCVIEGEFRSDSPAMKRFAADNDIEYEGGSFIVRRTVARSGRSRAFINDSPVVLPVLEEFGAMMVDIHSQHDTRLLTSRQYQLSIVDAFADNGSLLEQCASLYEQRRSLMGQIAELEQNIARANAEADYNRAVYEQLNSAGLREGEIEELEQEQNQLANAEQIKELLSASSALFDGNDDMEGVNSALGQLNKNLGKLAQYIKGFEDFAARLESARLELKDISAEVEAADQSLDVSEERLQMVDDRLGLLYGLMKRHGAADESELIAKRDALQSLVFGTEQLEEQLADLKAELDSCSAQYDNVAASLHERRVSKAGEFAEQILANLKFMELDKAAFDVQIEQCAPSASGTDQVSFMFNAAGGSTATLAKCASGGELSRIMLALKQLMSEFMTMPMMVFDEIDTGVSGSVADKMGSVICAMGERMQVFAITHLPQVAAKGQAHYLVEKTVGEGSAVSTIKKLSAEQRVLEIARMLSGSSLSQAAIDNARALLS